MKICRFLFLIISVSILFQPIQSQGRGEGNIYGKIINSGDDEPLEFATVALFKAEDSSLVTGNITNAEGRFVFNKVPFGKYYIEVKFVGFETQAIPDITVSPNQPDIQLGNLPLELASKSLEGVEIVADRQHVQYKLDKKVVNVSQDIISTSGTAVDVLEMTPSVTVDVEGNVSLRGSSNFTVYINGKPSVLSGTDALEQIPASTIENIEIITNPSARYDPDGVGGVINVVLKKSTRGGFTGLVNASAGTGDKYEGDFLFNLRKQKFNMFLGANAENEYHYGKGYLRKRYFNDTIPGFVDNPTLVEINDMDRTRFSKEYEFKAGVDYYLDEKTTITLSGTLGEDHRGRDYLNEMTEEYFYFEENDTNFTNHFLNPNEGERDEFYYSGNIDFFKTFGNDPEHKLMGLLFYAREEESDFDTQVEYITNPAFDPSSFVNERSRTEENGREREMRFKLDYIRPLSATAKFEAGFQSRMENEKEDFVFYRHDNVMADINTLNDLASTEFLEEKNNMEFDRNIHATYAIYSNQWDFLSLQAGLRHEYTDREIKYNDSQSIENKDSTVIKDFHSLFPSVHLSKELKNDQQIMASYSRRIDRPGGWALEPFSNYINSTTIRKGNPDLEPEFIDSYEINYQKGFGKSMVSFETYYRRTTNKITRIQSVEDNITTHTFKNLNKDHSIGLEAMTNVDFVEWFKLNASATVYYYKMEGEIISENLVDENFTWHMRLMPTFRFTPTTRLQLSAFYHGPGITAQGERSSMFFTSAALRQDLLNRQLSLTLQVRDIFRTAEFEFDSYGENFNNYVRFAREPQVVTLSVSYKINNYKNRDTNRDGGGNGGGGDDFGGDF